MPAIGAGKNDDDVTSVANKNNGNIIDANKSKSKRL